MSQTLRFADLALGARFHFGGENEWYIKTGPMACTSMYGDADAPQTSDQRVRLYNGNDWHGNPLAAAYQVPQPLTCVIQWIDNEGNATPDQNPAIGTVYQEAYTLKSAMWDNLIPQSKEYPICAEHAKRLAEPGMERWHFTPYAS